MLSSHPPTLFLLTAILCTLFWTLTTAEEPSCADYPRINCHTIPLCSQGNNTIPNYWLTHVNSSIYQQPEHRTSVTVCHDTHGLIIEETLIDPYPLAPFNKCNAEVWTGASSAELFISRVATPYDIPIEYFEIDTTPNGVTFGTIISNKKGNVTTCPTCEISTLKCHGIANFLDYPEHKIKISKTNNGWKTSRYLPFTMFDKFIHAGKVSNQFFRANLFRYDYPQGQNKPFVLAGASPTWSPSFHIPSRMMLWILTGLNTVEDLDDSY